MYYAVSTTPLPGLLPDKAAQPARTILETANLHLSPFDSAVVSGVGGLNSFTLSLMLTEICGMIRALKANDAAAALDYARLLADNLDKAGQHKDSSRVRRALGEQTTQAAPATLDHVR